MTEGQSRSVVVYVRLSQRTLVVAECFHWKYVDLIQDRLQHVEKTAGVAIREEIEISMRYVASSVVAHLASSADHTALASLTQYGNKNIVPILGTIWYILSRNKTRIGR